MKITIKTTVLTALFASIWLLQSCLQQTTIITDYEVVSSFEKRSDDRKSFLDENNNTFTIAGGQQQSAIQSRNGNFSVLTTPKAKYSLSTEFNAVGQDSYIEASVWKKGTNAHLVAVISDYPGYISTKEKVDTDNNGWEKLQLKLHIPPVESSSQVKFYVWNSGNDSVFFDDYSIRISSSKPLPEFTEEAFHIELDTSDYLKLMKVRKRAFTKGVLQSEDDDWIKGFVFAHDKMMKTNMRLKGDWLDHLHGNKWSFRFKLKKSNTWNRMRVFSIQNPMARLGVNEWLLHRFLISEDVLTTRYGFIPVTFNGQNLGIYAWEEHFAKQLVESQNRREGPIVRFFESALWDTRVYNNEGKRYFYNNPIFEVATIKPFSSGKTVESPLLFKQFLIAQNLMYQYKHRLKSASEIFNIRALAKYFASADVFLARHSIIWHNQRFYYNPVLCKLEPISYDCYSDIGLSMSEKQPIYGYISGNAIGTLNDEYLLTRELFNDTAFVDLYIKYLNKYSSASYLDSVFMSYDKELGYYDSLVKIEFPDQYFFRKEIVDNARLIREKLPNFINQVDSHKKIGKTWKNVSRKNVQYDTILESYTAPNLVLCYKQVDYTDSVILKINNYFPNKIVILGTGTNNKRMTEVVFPVPVIDGSRHGQPQSTEFTTLNKKAVYIFFSIMGNEEILTTEIMPWPEPTGAETPQQQLLADHPFPDMRVIDKIYQNTIYIKSDSITVVEPVIIPSGYSVVFNEGSYLDFIDSSCFISYSPILINGTEDNPVTINSSDFSSNGFTVLQAVGRSKVNFARFNNMNTMNYKGWVMTGAVNFYESDVDIDNSVFYRNQCEDALNIIRSQFILSNSLFDYVFSDAFDSDFSNGEVISTKFTNIGNDAIDFSGSNILIENVVVINAHDKGISGGEDSKLLVKNTNISNSNIGLSSKDLSVVEVINSEVNNCNYGLVLLQKKPEYGPSTLILKNCNIQNSKTRFLIEEGSVVIENGNTIQGKEKNVASLFY